MSSIHLVGGEKGGVGKSVLARLLCQWCIDNSVKWCGLDADLSQGALRRSYDKHCFAVDLSVLESADQIMDRALGAERQVVVDLPARSLGPLGQWLDTGAVLPLAAELQVTVVYWHVTDGGFESVQGLHRSLALLGPTPRVVVVCNRGRSSDFSQLHASASLKDLSRRGERTIELPKLEADIMYETEVSGVSLGVALRERHGERGLTPMQQRRGAKWLKDAYSGLDPILRELSEPDRMCPEPTVVLPVPAAERPAPPTRTGPPVGTIIHTGASTWTEVGDGCLIHHVRYNG